MVFSEKIKLEAKKKSHYKCCMCESVEFIEVHHIIPQEDKGLDDLENAAPLCTRCHKMLGGNKDLRKWVKEKRDFWYEFCEKKLKGDDLEILEKISIIMGNLEKEKTEQVMGVAAIRKNVDSLQEKIIFLTEQNNSLAKSLKDASLEQQIPIFLQMQSTSNAISSSALVSGAALASIEPGQAMEVRNPSCPRCGSQTWLFVSDYSAPQCSSCGFFLS